MIVVTTPFLAGYRVRESKGMVFGLVVRSRGLGGNIMRIWLDPLSGERRYRAEGWTGP